VVAALSGLPEDKRADVLEKLIPRLWNDCKITEADRAPTQKQLLAKDAMSDLRPIASAKQRDEIDGYLLDWLTLGGFYELRSPLGSHDGDKIVRTMGPKAAPKLLQAARALLEEQRKSKEFEPIGPRLLKGIALTGSPEGVGFLLQLAGAAQEQEELQDGAMTALYEAYVTDPDDPPIDRKSLLPHLKTLEGFGKAEIGSVPAVVINASYELIAAAGAPHCLPPLVALAAHPNPRLTWRAVEFGLKCGGLDAIVPIAEALPQNADYNQKIVAKYFVGRIEPGVRAKAVQSARTLLQSKSWVARFVGIELLADAGGKADAAELRKLAKDKTRLRGFAREPGDEEGKKRPKDPTLGERAVAVADLLEKKP
jgi:hypothetical protein